MNNIKIKFLKSLIIISYIFLYMVSIYTFIFDIRDHVNFIKTIGVISFIFLCIIIITPLLLYRLGYNGLLKFHLLFIFLASLEGIYFIQLLTFDKHIGSTGLVLSLIFATSQEILLSNIDEMFRVGYYPLLVFILPLIISLYYHRIYNKIIKNNSSIHSKLSIHIHKKVNSIFIITYFIIGFIYLVYIYTLMGD